MVSFDSWIKRNLALAACTKNMIGEKETNFCRGILETKITIKREETSGYLDGQGFKFHGARL